MLFCHKIHYIWMINALLLQNLVVEIYALFPPIFLGWQIVSANFFCFLDVWSGGKGGKIWPSFVSSNSNAKLVIKTKLPIVAHDFWVLFYYLSSFWVLRLGTIFFCPILSLETPASLFFSPIHTAWHLCIFHLQSISSFNSLTLFHFSSSDHASLLFYRFFPSSPLFFFRSLLFSPFLLFSPSHRSALVSSSPPPHHPTWRKHVFLLRQNPKSWNLWQELTQCLNLRLLRRHALPPLSPSLRTPFQEQSTQSWT